MLATLGRAAALLAVGAGLAHAVTTMERKLDRRLRPPRVARHAAGLVPVVPVQRVGERVRVYVRVASTDETTLAALVAAGAQVEIVDTEGRRVQALVSPAEAAALAALPAVVTVRPAEPGRHATGSVTSEGDAAAGADLVRGLGYDGSGTRVGIISDGIDHLASAQASGDLDAVVVPADPRCRRGSGDEGTALLEIVHDLAPGAALLYSEGLTSSLVFIQSVQCLIAAGAAVIADDLIYFDEPFFADGAIAAAVRGAVQAGVSYHTAAGNSAQVHLEQPYRKAPASAYHDFRGGPTDETDDLLVPPQTTVVCILQWNDPFGASANDYDLELYDGANVLVDASTSVQDGTQDPIEVVAGTNVSGSPAVGRVKIRKAAGADRLLEMFCLDAASEYVTPGDSIFGQAGIPEALAVAAIDVADAGLDEVEPFSSRGPATILFPAPATRPKPDLAAFDGVSISNAGGFPACPPFCAFFGTSAAAPHSAAVAALLLGKNPFLTPADIADALRASAADVGPPGFDTDAGAGRLDAVAALAAVPPPECFDASTCTDGDACTTDVCSRGRCVFVAARCDDGDLCSGTESCDPAVGCVPGVPLSCADGDSCTADACDPAQGCVFPELPGIDFLACALAEHLRPLLPLPESTAGGRATRVARRLLTRLATAERQVARARGTGRVRARRRLAAARRTVVRMQRIATRAEPVLGETVVEPIVFHTRVIARKIRAVRQML